MGYSERYAMPHEAGQRPAGAAVERGRCGGGTPAWGVAEKPQALERGGLAPPSPWFWSEPHGGIT